MNYDITQKEQCFKGELREEKLNNFRYSLKSQEKLHKLTEVLNQYKQLPKSLDTYR